VEGLVPLILTGKGRASNKQNELGRKSEVRNSKSEGLEEAADLLNEVGPEDGGRESGRRTGGGDQEYEHEYEYEQD
jgi:hypothetical protein